MLISFFLISIFFYFFAMNDPNDRSFFGHPRGLGYIAFAEAWERFSYYGMQALLVLYMVNRLLHPGHVEHIAGFVPFRHLIESLRGPLDIQPLASTIFGLYTGLVYLTPIAGGLLADRWLGRTRTITIGALLRSLAFPHYCGHSQPANLQRLLGLGAGPCRSHFLREKNANDMANHAR